MIQARELIHCITEGCSGGGLNAVRPLCIDCSPETWIAFLSFDEFFREQVDVVSRSCGMERRDAVDILIGEIGIALLVKATDAGVPIPVSIKIDNQDKD